MISVNKQLSRIGIALGLLLISPLEAKASSFSEFVFFGDSITDSGNVFLATGETVEPPFGELVLERPYSNTLNFSDGPIWAQYLADFNNLDADPSLAGGTNFAFGGATSQSLPTVPSPSLEEQLDLWQLATFNNADPDAFYFVQGGGNDVRIALTLPDASQANLFLQNSANAATGVVEELIDAGATNIAIVNSPDLGLVPESVLGGFSSEATALSQLYNTSVTQALESVDLEGINFIEVDTFGFINSLTDDPTAFGFRADTVTNSSCVLPDFVCNNPNEFVFFDGIHPTTATHFAFANVVNGQINDSTVPVPEPSTLLFFGLSSIFLVSKKRK